MISPVELRRIVAEWRLRLQRAKDILQPPTWSEQEWRKFSQALALMVRDHGQSWIIEPNVYWDLRWRLQDGAELVCQIEHTPGVKTSLVVAQNGGFATDVGSYTWLWAEFNMEGNFARDPYWVEGTWKEALTALLVPLDRQASYLLAGRAETPTALLLQDGARPNDQNYMALMPGINEEKLAEQRPEEHPPEHSFSPEQNSGHSMTPAESRPIEIAVETQPTQEIPPPATEPMTPEPEPAQSKIEPPPSPRVDTPEPFAIRWGMPQKLTWKDTDEIAYALIDTHPDQDPLKLSLPKLHQLVIKLEDFGDDPDKSSEAILESILMAWYEEVK